MERHPSQNLHPLISHRHMRPLPGFPVRPPWKEVPISSAFFYASRFPVKRDVPLTEPSFHYLSFPSKRTSQRDPYRARHPSTEPSTSHPLKIHLYFRVPDKGAPSMLPNRVPMDRDTPSPEPLVYLFMSYYTTLY